MFASDGIHQIGSSTALAVGPEQCRAPVAELIGGLAQPGPAFQTNVLTYPLLERPSENPVGGAPDSVRPRQHTADAGKGPGLQVQPTRRSIPTPAERRSWRGGPLTGLLFDRKHDPEQRGIAYEQMEGQAVSAPGMQPLPDGSAYFDDTTQTVIHPDPGNDPDTARHVQSVAHSEPAIMLRSVRHAYPTLPILPIPVGRSVAITAKDTPTEINFPDGTTLARIVWSGSRSGVDLLISFVGAVAPVAIANTGSNASYDGTLLNPDIGSYYYVKGKRSVSVMVPGSSLDFPAVCVVCVHCYVNN